MSDAHQHDSDQQQIHRVYETRYRTSKYFLNQQLRCSEAVQDFRTVKSMMEATAFFNVRRAFRFAMEAVPVQTQSHKPPKR
jgi:hypothetical protein